MAVVKKQAVAVVEPEADTLQYKIINYLMGRLRQANTDLSKNLSFESGYLIKEGGANFNFYKSDPDRLYGNIEEEFIPVMFVDFVGVVTPIPELESQTTTVNIQLLLSKNIPGESNNLNDAQEVIEQWLRGLEGHFDNLDDYAVAFNSTPFTPSSGTVTFASKSRVVVDVSIHFSSTKGGVMGNEIITEIKPIGGVFERFYPTERASSRGFTEDLYEPVGNVDAVVACSGSVLDFNFSFALPKESIVAKQLIVDKFSPESLNTKYVVKTTMPHDYGTYEKTVTAIGISLSPNIGALTVLGVIFKVVDENVE